MKHTYSPKSFDPILLLRGVVFLVILWYHNLPPNGWLFVHGINLSFFTNFSGMAAVYIFYIISGYSVGYGFFSGKYAVSSLRSLAQYIKNRLLRIIPAYYACLFVSIFIIYRNVPITWSAYLRFFSFTANINYLNLPYMRLLVIISTEMQFYLIAPILYVLLNTCMKKIPRHLIVLFIFFVGFIIRYGMLRAGLVNDESMFMEHIYVTVWGTLDYFLFGMLISSFIAVRKHVISLEKRNMKWIFVFCLIGCVFWINSTNNYVHPWDEFMRNHMFIFPPILSTLFGWYVLAFSSSSTKIKSITRPNDIMQYLIHPKTFLYSIGSLSYGLYLYHYIFVDVLYRSSGNIPNDMPDFLHRFVITLVLALGAAFVSYVCIEYPFLRLKYTRH